MTAIFENECHYCMAGHTQLAKMQKIDDNIVRAIRNGQPISDPNLKALRAFATKVVRDVASRRTPTSPSFWRRDTPIATCLKSFWASARRC
jgi:alkylhydroperoxidase family enzyme